MVKKSKRKDMSMAPIQKEIKKDEVQETKFVTLDDVPPDGRPLVSPERIKQGGPVHRPPVSPVGLKDFWKTINITVAEYGYSVIVEAQFINNFGVVQKITTVQNGRVVSVNTVLLNQVRLKTFKDEGTDRSHIDYVSINSQRTSDEY